MVKKIFISFMYFIFFTLSLMCLVPKPSVYYFFESKLNTYDLVIANEEIDDTSFCLYLKNADLYFKSINIANISEADMKLFVIYNRLSLQNITLSSALKSFIPGKVDELNFSYTILNPLNVKAYIIGEFGKAEATFNILDKALHIELVPSKIMFKEYQNTLSKLTKTERGDYVYDKIF